MYLGIINEMSLILKANNMYLALKFFEFSELHFLKL